MEFFILGFWLFILFIDNLLFYYLFLNLRLVKKVYIVVINDFLFIKLIFLFIFYIDIYIIYKNIFNCLNIFNLFVKNYCLY